MARLGRRPPRRARGGRREAMATAACDGVTPRRQKVWPGSKRSTSWAEAQKADRPRGQRRSLAASGQQIDLIDTEFPQGWGSSRRIRPARLAIAVLAFGPPAHALRPPKRLAAGSASFAAALTVEPRTAAARRRPRWLAPTSSSNPGDAGAAAAVVNAPRQPIDFAVAIAALARLGLIGVTLSAVARRQQGGDSPATQGRKRRRRIRCEFGRSKTSHLRFVDRPRRPIVELKAGRSEG
jgi:hypothetical protein